jgi:GH24 family phage-related lysozyme (muramidase)
MKLSFDAIKAHIVPHEGVVSHMYLDTVGKVTVGVGNMLPDGRAAEALPFVDRVSSAPATAAEKRADFEAVLRQPKARPAKLYKPHTKLILPDDAIWQLLERRVEGFERQLVGIFPQFPSFPETAQLALLDMAFNLGAGALDARWPSLKQAALAQNWHAAELECNRSTSSRVRNNATRELFRKAVGQGSLDQAPPGPG